MPLCKLLSFPNQRQTNFHVTPHQHHICCRRTSCNSYRRRRCGWSVHYTTTAIAVCRDWAFYDVLPDWAFYKNKGMHEFVSAPKLMRDCLITQGQWTAKQHRRISKHVLSSWGEHQMTWHSKKEKRFDSTHPSKKSDLTQPTLQYASACKLVIYP